MNQTLRFDYSHACKFFEQTDLDQLAPEVLRSHIQLHQGTGAGSELRGWLDLPIKCEKSERERIVQAATRIQENSDVLLVIGIGGSYLGAKAALEMLGHHFTNLLPAGKRRVPEIYFVGNNISPVYLAHLLELLEGKEVSLNVISKSGTTMEPAYRFSPVSELDGEKVRTTKSPQPDLRYDRQSEGSAPPACRERGV